MKKSILFIVFSLFVILYASEIKLNAIDDGNVLISENNYSSTATYVTQDGVEISVMGTHADESEIKFAVQITNNSQKDFNFNENSIAAYQGIYEQENWAGTTYYPASKYYSLKEYEYGAAVTVAAVGCGVLMMDLMLASACDSDPAPRRPGHNHNVRPAPRPETPGPARPGPAKPRPKTPRKRPSAPEKRPVAPRSYNLSSVKPSSSASVHITYDFTSLFTLLNNESKDLFYLQNGLLFSQVIKPGETVNGVFFIERHIGPDYKLSFFVPEEGFINFYFTRSDKQSVLHPWKDDNDSHNSLLLTLSLPVPKRVGLSYIYSGVPVGVYAGFNYQYPWGVNYGLSGLWDGDTYKPDHRRKNYIYTFEPNGKSNQESFSVYGGLNVKTVPHTWLMFGCGCDVVTYFNEGNEHIELESDPSVYDDRLVWTKEPEVRIYCTPQVGVNFIFNVIDVAGTFGYRIGAGPQFDLMMGIAF